MTAFGNITMTSKSDTLENRIMNSIMNGEEFEFLYQELRDRTKYGEMDSKRYIKFLDCVFDRYNHYKEQGEDEYTSRFLSLRDYANKKINIQIQSRE